MVVSPLVGRETEIVVIDDLLDRAEAHGAALALRGEAGVGKSALLAVARRDAESRGFVVLATSGVQAETSLPYAALHRLLRPLLPRLDELPTPQRTAIAAAFGIEQEAAPVFLVGLGALTLLADRAAESPLLTLVDDSQWLDQLSAQVLSFLVRRLEADPIAILAACRDDDADLAKIELPVLRVPPLDRRSSEAILDADAPELDSLVRERVLREAEGNPLALVELPIASRSQPGAPPPTQELPLTARLEDAFCARFGELPENTRNMLLVAALDEEGAIAEIEAAARSLAGGAAASWEPAIAVGLVTIEKDMVRFGHPLQRSAIAQSSTPEQRHAIHAALADVLADRPDRALWHRAASSAAPNEKLAGELDAAAKAALKRGAIVTAKMALERAAMLSDDSQRKGRRLLGAAELARDLGRPQEVLWLLNEVEGVEHAGPNRTRLAWLREEMTGAAWSSGERIRSLVEIAEQFTDEGSVKLALRCLQDAALRIWWTTPGEDFGPLVIDALARIPIDDHDPRLLLVLAYSDPVGHGATVLERLSEIDPDRVADPVDLHLLGAVSHSVWAFDLALVFLSRALDGLRAQGQLGIMARTLAYKAWAALHLGRVTIAEAAADEAIRFAEETSQGQWVAVAKLAQAALLCERGRSADAEGLLVETEAASMSTGKHSMLAMAQFARGRGAVADQQYERGLDHLGRALNPKELASHPAIGAWGLSDLIEAAVSLGDMEAAARYGARLEELVSATGAPMLAVELAYVRPLLADDERRGDLYEAALADGLVDWPSYRGRLQLSYGRWLRRHRRVAESRVPLRAARETFDALAFDALAEKARQELRATGETSRRRTDDARDQLTPQELKIAQMAAAGLSNKEIGRELFLSHRTVESHLYRMFPKLGITSRAELHDALPDAVTEAPRPVGETV